MNDGTKNRSVTITPSPKDGRRHGVPCGGGEIAQGVTACNTPVQKTHSFLVFAWPLVGGDALLYKPASGDGVWLSLLEHRVRDAGVAGSNPATPTTKFSTYCRLVTSK